MSKEYRIKEQKYKYPHGGKHGSLFIPQYREIISPLSCKNWRDLLYSITIPNKMEEAIKVIEKDIEKEKEKKVEEIIIHNYPLNQNKDEN